VLSFDEQGSVRKAGKRMRITAQLIDARSDTQLWSETYDRPLDDIFAVQDEIKEVYDIWRAIGLPMALRATGHEAESMTALTELISKFAKDAAYTIAYVLACRGEIDRAFEWLERAAAIRDPGLSEIAVQRLFGLHHDFRWLSFLRSFGRAPDQLGAIEFDVKVSH
jgi:hypothetical protein